MIALLHPLFADISSLPWPAIIAISGGMLITIVVIVGGLLFAHRRQAMWHETARLALEKGQPLPKPLDDEDNSEPVKREQRDGRNDLRAGLIMIGVGAGLYIFLANFISHGLGLVGAIPGFIGVALFLYGLTSLLLTKHDSTPPPSDRA
jgi:hypothetical protein